VFWPVYAPITVLLIEPGETRRRLLWLCLALGAGISAYLLWYILTRPHSAVIQDDHIVYLTGYGHSTPVGLAYLAAISVPLTLSSQRTIVILGSIILVGCATSLVFYWESFVSVWCFFAAAASVVILCHFEWGRRQRLHIVGA
jgi:hypothetical protein